MSRHSELPSITLSRQAAKMKSKALDAPGRGRGEGTQLAILAPEETVQALRVAAAERRSTMRALVLEALAAAGWPVPKGEVVDRRR